MTDIKNKEVKKKSITSGLEVVLIYFNPVDMLHKNAYNKGQEIHATGIIFRRNWSNPKVPLKPAAPFDDFILQGKYVKNLS